MSGLVTKIRAFFTAKPSREERIFDLMREIVESQREQTKVFAQLVSAWTQPVPVEPPPRSADEDRILEDLENAAESGDPDAQALLANEEELRRYVKQFR